MTAYAYAKHRDGRRIVLTDGPADDDPKSLKLRMDLPPGGELTLGRSWDDRAMYYELDGERMPVYLVTEDGRTL